MPRKPTDAPEGYMSKITMKGIGCIPVGSDTPTDQCVVWGRATGTEDGETDMPGGDVFSWTCLSGDFAAEVYSHDGKGQTQTYRSGRLFLPAGIQEVVEAGLVSEDGKPKTISVDFCLLMQTKKSGSKAGFQWVAKALLAPQRQNDPIEEIRARFIEAANQRALAAGATPERETVTPKDVGKLPAPTTEASAKRK